MLFRSGAHAARSALGMPAPLVEPNKEFLNGLIFRPEIAQQDARIAVRSLTLLGNQLVHCGIGVKVAAWIVALIHRAALCSSIFWARFANFRRGPSLPSGHPRISLFILSIKCCSQGNNACSHAGLDFMTTYFNA